MDSKANPKDDAFSEFCLEALTPLTTADTPNFQLPQSFPLSNPPFPSQIPQSTHCTCRKSKCLKLYCECFANKTFCVDCACVKCYNQPKKKKFRDNAVKRLIERNPEAFGNTDRPCNCRKSRCKKKYCECFYNGKKCSEECKCIDCTNS